METGGSLRGVQAKDRGCNSGVDCLPLASGGSQFNSCSGFARTEGSFSQAELLSSELGSTSAARRGICGSEIYAPDGGHHAARQSGE